MTSSTTHLTAEQSRKLLDLCPELQRELRVGDWIECKEGIKKYHKTPIFLVTHITSTGKLQLSDCSTEDPADCLLLPQEHDLHDALERVTEGYYIGWNEELDECGHYDGMYRLVH
jgi:hypothetical protein